MSRYILVRKHDGHQPSLYKLENLMDANLHAGCKPQGFDCARGDYLIVPVTPETHPGALRQWDASNWAYKPI